MRSRSTPRILTLVACIATSVAGCGGKGWAPVWSQANAEFSLEFNPLTRKFKLYNNKDVSIKVKKFSGKMPGGVQWLLEGLEVTDNASAVRAVNVGQMQAGTEMTRVVTDLLAQLGPLLVDGFKSYLSTRQAIALKPTTIQQLEALLAEAKRTQTAENGGASDPGG